MLFLENVFKSDNNTSVMAHIGSTISLGCQVKKEAQFGVVSKFFDNIIDEFLKQMRLETARKELNPSAPSAEPRHSNDSSGNSHTDGILNLNNQRSNKNKAQSLYLQAGTQVTQENDTSGAILEPTVELATHVSNITASKGLSR